MQEKNKIKITEIVLNDATYHNVTINPTNINFFIGKNGTGKSTIGRAILSKTGLKWKNPTDEADTIIQVYNEDYIRSNIQSLDNMPGVFNISEADIEVENELKALNSKLESTTRNKATAAENINKISTELTNIKNNSVNDAWNIIKTYYDKYSKQTAIKKGKEKAYDAIKDISPKMSSDADLDQLYEAAFDSNSKIYMELNKITASAPSYNLSNPIVGKSNSQFSDFIKKLNNLDWVREGHSHYENNPDNKCPYCQRELTPDIRKEIMDCFDESYQNQVDGLNAFSKSYALFKDGIKRQIEQNKSDWYPKNDKQKYDLIASSLISKIEKNEGLIKDKISHLSNSYSLEDISPELNNLNNFINEANKEIQLNNSLLGPKAKDHFHDVLKGHLAFLCMAIITSRNNDEKLKNDEKANEENIKSTAINDIANINKRISELSEKTTSSRPVVNHINSFLKESNFQGFSIDASDDKHYKLIRQDGSIARSLSEGEKNFICFLYFYFSIFGSVDGSKDLKDRVIVIDDPVSSMDSDSVFIISFLIRHLVEVCKNAISYNPSDNLDKHVKQLFILTHNSFFYNEIAPVYINDYEYANFYEINKKNNISSIKLGESILNKGEVNEKHVNYIPKLGTYATLWEEYKEAKTASIMLNVQRRIIETYFLQSLGITPGDLYKEILEKNKDSFEISDNGNKDYINIMLAKSMLCYLDTSASSMTSTLYYSLPTDDLERFRNTFKTIFIVMHQEGHYKMMMRED